MFVRLTRIDGVKLNLNLNHIIHVRETPEGSNLTTSAGEVIGIQESGQTFRNAVKKKAILPGNKDAAEAAE